MKILWSEVWKGRFQLIQILGLLYINFDAGVVFVTKFSLYLKGILYYLSDLTQMHHCCHMRLSICLPLFHPFLQHFFCDFLHVCLSNNLITVFIKSHSYTYLIKNLSFNERSYLLIWKKKTIRLKKVWLQCVHILQSRKLRVLQIFVHKCLAVILEVSVLVTEIKEQIF